MYVNTGRALSATEADALQRGIAALPLCYAQELDNCVNELPGPKVRGCEFILAGYAADEDKMEAAVDAVPFCLTAQASALGASWQVLLAVGAMAAAAGVVVGTRLK